MLATHGIAGQNTRIETASIIVNNNIYRGLAFDVPSVEAQGSNGQPYTFATQFKYYKIAIVNGKVYDPSYGTVYADKISSENSVIQLFYYSNSTENKFFSELTIRSSSN